ncbi:hypothetical protein L195_g060600, partial [Trifolium pratense]
SYDLKWGGSQWRAATSSSSTSPPSNLKKNTAKKPWKLQELRPRNINNIKTSSKVKRLYTVFLEI